MSRFIIIYLNIDIKLKAKTTIILECIIYIDTKITIYSFVKKSLTGSECEYRHDGGWRTAHVPRAVHIN
jgi:hypothetical protein